MVVHKPGDISCNIMFVPRLMYSKVLDFSHIYISLPKSFTNLTCHVSVNTHKWWSFILVLLFQELKEELEAKTKAESESGSNTPSARGDAVVPSQQTDDNSSMLNHFVLLGAVALLAYLAHTVVKHSQELGGWRVKLLTGHVYSCLLSVSNLQCRE